MPPSIDKGITPDRSVSMDIPSSRDKNPFSSVHSGYGKVVDGKFTSVYTLGSSMQRFHTDAVTYFKGFAGHQDFPCLAGRSVARTDQYAFCAYPDMLKKPIAEGIMHDMIRFQQEFGIPHDTTGRGHRFRSFVAAFANPIPQNPLQGAEALYTLLGNMHEQNKQYYDWVDGFSNDTDSPKFGYSSGDSAFFIASFHPGAYDVSRRSDINFVVFNSHAMLDSLKSEGKFHQLREAIRNRQAHVHPYLGDHGDVLEWRQYALLEPKPMTERIEVALRTKVLGDCPFPPKQE